jgi:hypothetical protein
MSSEQPPWSKPLVAATSPNNTLTSAWLRLSKPFPIGQRQLTC